MWVNALLFTYHAYYLTPAFVVDGKNFTGAVTVEAAPALGDSFLREAPVQALLKSGPEINFRLRLGLAPAQAPKYELGGSQGPQRRHGARRGG